MALRRSIGRKIWTAVSVLTSIVAYLRDQARTMPLVVPLHPRTQEALERTNLRFDSDAIKPTGPLGYLDMCQLTRSAAMVLTDSGGLQREAYFHRVPSVTLRDQTEWTETIECGWNRLWTTPKYLPRRDIPQYDNARAAEASIKRWSEN